MLDRLFKKNRTKVEKLLEAKGANIVNFRKNIEKEDRELLFKHFEENFADKDFKVLDAPLILNTNLGDFAFPLVIEVDKQIYTYYPFSQPIDAPTLREMLVLFGILKQKKYLGTSVIILSEGEVPESLQWFCRDSHASRFLLLSLIEVNVDNPGGFHAKSFDRIFTRVFSEKLKRTIKSLIRFDEIATEKLKNIPPEIFFFEPFRSAAILIRSYLTAVLDEDVEASVSKRYRSDEKSHYLVMEYKGMFFALDPLEKILRDFSSPLPFSFGRFVLEIRNCLLNPKHIPDSLTLPFFRWIHPFTQVQLKKRSPESEAFNAEIAPIRAAHVKERKALSAIQTFRCFRCPRCEKIMIEEGSIPHFIMYTANTFRQRARVAAALQGNEEKSAVECPYCKIPVDAKEMEYFSSFRYFPGLKIDLQYNIEKFIDGRLIERWFITKDDGEIVYAGHDVKEDDLAEVMGRHVSAVPHWENLFERSFESKKVDMLAVEDYYYIMVVPELSLKNRERQIKELTDPLLLSGKRYQIYDLLELDDSGKFDHTQSFRRWLHGSAGYVIDESFRLKAYFDVIGYYRKIREVCEEKNLYTDEKSEKELILFRNEYRESLKVEDIILKVIHTGADPMDYIHIKTAQIKEEFDNYDRFLTLLSRAAGGFAVTEFDNEAHIFRVTLAQSGKTKVFNPCDCLEKYGKNEEELIRVLKKEMGFEIVEKPDQCHCEKPAIISIRLRSPKWVEEESSKGQNLVTEGIWNNAIPVYYRICPDHMTAVNEDLLGKWNLSKEELFKTFRRRLAKNVFAFRIGLREKDGNKMVGIIGKNAASIAFRKEWVKAVLDGIPPFFDGQECRLYAPERDVLIIANPKTPRADLGRFYRTLERAGTDDIEVKENLGFTMNLELPRHGRGEINLISVKDELQDVTT